MAPFKAMGRGYGANLRKDEYYIVASMGWETNHKSILTATNLNTSKTYLLDKTVKMTKI